MLSDMAYVSTVLEGSRLNATHSKLTPPHWDPTATEKTSDRRSTAILFWKVNSATGLVADTVYPLEIYFNGRTVSSEALDESSKTRAMPMEPSSRLIEVRKKG